jgi:hypothetical protein
VPSEWIGNLNVTYRYGGRLKNNRTITINVYNQRATKKIYNVIGVLKGSLEPGLSYFFSFLFRLVLIEIYMNRSLCNDRKSSVRRFLKL